MDAAFFYRFCFCALSGKSLPVRVALNLRSLDSLVTSLRIRRPRFECEVTTTSAKRTVKRTITRTSRQNKAWRYNTIATIASDCFAQCYTQNSQSVSVGFDQ